MIYSCFSVRVSLCRVIHGRLNGASAWGTISRSEWSSCATVFDMRLLGLVELKPAKIFELVK